MKLLLIAATLTLSTNIAVFAQDHDHHKMDTASAAKNTKPAQRFVADSNLKIRMEKILNTVRTLHSKNNDKDQAKVIGAGKEIESTVNDIFKSCKLEEAADAAIHPVLGGILGGAESYKKGNAKDGHEKIHQALLKYEELFSHQGWKH